MFSSKTTTTTSSSNSSSSRNIYTNLMYACSYFLASAVMLASFTQAIQGDRFRTSRSGTSVDMDSLNSLVGSLDAHLEHFQKRTCRLGLHSNNCVLERLHDMMKQREYLHSGMSPGKRSEVKVTEGQVQGYPVNPEDILKEARSLQNNVAAQRQTIWRLKRLLQSINQASTNEASTSETAPQKRSCRFRLGGHCLTEELDSAASQYNYLQSPSSPGRKRRSTGAGEGAGAEAGAGAESSEVSDQEFLDGR